MEEKQQEATGSQLAKSQAVPAPLEEDVIDPEEPAKKKNKREQKEERQKFKKTKKSKVQSQQESSEKPKSKKLKREESESENEEVSQDNSLEMAQMQQAIDVAKLERNGNGLRAKKPGAKPNAKKRKRSPSEGTEVIVHVILRAQS